MQSLDSNVIREGAMTVTGGHVLRWQEWGNPGADKTILFNHGGPGSGFKDKHKSLFDPSTHRVIFYDQRGCGKSIPFAEVTNNTTQDLIEDIEQLRIFFGLEQFILVGGSWGSTLSLLYAINYPKRVYRILLWSVYLIRQFETDFVNDGRLEYFFPEAWSRFIDLVPKQERTSGDAIMAYYADMIKSSDAEVATRYADEWTLWEASLITLSYNKAQLENDVLGDPNNLAIARVETHYFMNKCFVPENYILNNIGKLRNIPCDVVHGRFDMCTPVISAVDLKNAWPGLNLQIVNSGHLRSDPEMFAALKETINKNF